MPFAATTRDRVMAILNLPVVAPFWVQRVQDALDSAENYGGETAVTRIEADITAYLAAETALNTNSAKRGLIRADVLEWTPGGQTEGYATEMSRYKEKILCALFTPWEQEEIRKMNRSTSTVRIRR